MCLQASNTHPHALFHVSAGVQHTPSRPLSCVCTPQALTAKLQASNIFFQTQRPGDMGRVAVYASAKLPPSAPLLIELTFAAGAPGVRIAVRSPQLVRAVCVCVCVWVCVCVCV